MGGERYLCAGGVEELQGGYGVLFGQGGEGGESGEEGV